MTIIEVSIEEVSIGEVFIEVAIVDIPIMGATEGVSTEAVSMEEMVMVSTDVVTGRTAATEVIVHTDTDTEHTGIDLDTGVDTEGTGCTGLDTDYMGGTGLYMAEYMGADTESLDTDPTDPTGPTGTDINVSIAIILIMHANIIRAES